MGNNIVDLAGTTKRSTRGESLSVVRRNIERRRIGSIEIIVVLFVTGNEGSSRQCRYACKTAGILGTHDTLAGGRPKDSVTAGRVGHSATICSSACPIVDASWYPSQQDEIINKNMRFTYLHVLPPLLDTPSCCVPAEFPDLTISATARPA